MASRRFLALFLAPSLLLLSACGGGEAEDSAEQNDTTGGTHVTVTLTDQGCDPPNITIEEGKIVFDVSNEGSTNVTEFHVLKPDDSVVGELKDVMSGQEKTLTLDLQEGEYVTRCPNGATERGTLSVKTGGPDGGPGGGGTNETPEGGDGGTEGGPGGGDGGGTEDGPGSGGDGDSAPRGGG